MKTILEPSVVCIGQMSFDRDAMQPYLESVDAGEWSTDAASHGEALIESAGRICYRSFATPRPGGNRAYIARILDERHGSVTEHANYAMLITGISRTCSLELIRHRHLSFSQRSQRYCDDSDIGFVVPPALVGWLDTDAGVEWQDACHWSLSRYQRQVRYMESKADIADLPATDRRKAARQTARSVLPGCTATEMVVTGNARAWRGVLEQRGSRHADAEIRRLALVILGVLAEASPALFGDYRTEAFGDGQFEITTPHPKV